MNPIDAITSITGHVLIRIGNAILGNQAASESQPIRIGEVHIHCAQPADADSPGRKTRTWRRR
ncbi:hypothetical protein [Rhodococcus spongiicola]|uniref:Uncharacterized protein n=1 Tax=Rhodococcus spongiicola TaxID=2487352 RepID=A0A3S3E657_9NOCA|nr:hypothetical protein [Rhodococcus spongiicola]RVW06236.1 hypothetical protein EF834_01920 [Rhodococcus spongiicola]